MYLNNFTKSDNFYIKNKTSSLHERRFALKNKRWKLKFPIEKNTKNRNRKLYRLLG